MPNVTINNSNPSPAVAPISKGANASDLTLVFQVSANDNSTYKLSGLTPALVGPDPVQITNTTPSGTYTANPNFSGRATYAITVVAQYEGPSDGTGQIQVDP